VTFIPVNYCIFTFWVPCCDVPYDFLIKMILYLVRLYLSLFVGWIMSYLRYLCLLAQSGVQHILCCVFVLFFFALCTQFCQLLWIVYLFSLPLRYSLTFILVLCALCCQFLWIVHFWLPLRYSLTFILVLCTLCCLFLWIVHFWLPLRYSLTFILVLCALCCQFLWIVHFLIAPSVFSNVYSRLVCPMLSVSLDCPFLIALSLFSNVYSTSRIRAKQINIPIKTPSSCIY
jgi:hypothetical protein